MPQRSRPGARTPRVTLSACLFLLGAGAAFAQVSKNPALPTEPIPPSLVREADGRVIVRATRVTEPIRLDGRLDESVYSRIPPITDFIQQEPIEGAAVTERTEAWILFDDKNIYIVCRCWQANPELIVANDISRGDAGFDVDINIATLITTSGEEQFPLGQKTELASLILDRAEALL